VTIGDIVGVGVIVIDMFGVGVLVGSGVRLIGLDGVGVTVIDGNWLTHSQVYLAVQEANFGAQ